MSLISANKTFASKALLWLPVAIVALQACGGGGGGPPQPPDEDDPPTVSVTVSSTSVDPGSTVTVTWSTENATSCLASGAWSGTKATSGTESVGPISSDATFGLECTGPGGTAQGSSTVSMNPIEDGVASYSRASVDPALVTATA